VIVSSDPHVPVSEQQQAELRGRWSNPYRVLVALRLARDAETCAELLRGEPIDPDRLDQAGLSWASERLLVRLDLYAIDLPVVPA
jgi:hypothetical protein